ncbi:DUF4399 domain-containing protein [soil metagenome]
MMKAFVLLISMMPAAAMAANRAPAATAAVTSNMVKFVEPINGAKVAEKFKVKMEVDGYKIAPLGTMTKGTGHHHLIVDGAPIAAGQVVPADKTHIHFGKGQTETELELAPGKHKLTLQFADGSHMSYGPAMSQTIEIEVQPKKM